MGTDIMGKGDSQGWAWAFIVLKCLARGTQSSLEEMIIEDECWEARERWSVSKSSVLSGEADHVLVTAVCQEHGLEKRWH